MRDTQKNTARVRIAAWIPILCFAGMLPSLAAPRPLTASAPLQSSSGQFVVFAQNSVPLPFPLRQFASNTNFIFLEPTLLVISCERIKQKLSDRLGLAEFWRGKIYLNLHPARSAADNVTIVAEKSAGGWDYSVSMPDLLPRERFLRAIVRVLLSEIANRNAGSHPAEIPLWLVEGFCGELRADGDVELFLPPPTTLVNGLVLRQQTVNSRWTSPGQQAGREFQSRPPLTYEQLSWPNDTQLAGDRGEIYSRSALLFVDALLRQADGPACFRSFLAQLPGFYNWQLAFLQSFHSHFQSPLDIEKWWALQVVYLTGRGLFDRWTVAESLQKLDQTLLSRVEVRTQGNELPTRSAVDLQTVIREWDLAAQAGALQRKLPELELFRPRVAPQVVYLVDEYRAAIQTYLRRRGLDGPDATARRGGPVGDRISEETIAQLNALDSQAQAFQTTAQADIKPDLPQPLR